VCNLSASAGNPAEPAFFPTLRSRSFVLFSLSQTFALNRRVVAVCLIWLGPVDRLASTRFFFPASFLSLFHPPPLDEHTQPRQRSFPPQCPPSAVPHTCPSPSIITLISFFGCYRLTTLFPRPFRIFRRGASFSCSKRFFKQLVFSRFLDVSPQWRFSFAICAPTFPQNGLSTSRLCIQAMRFSSVHDDRPTVLPDRL